MSPSKFDGKKWWQQPIWRKVLFYAGLGFVAIGMIVWQVLRRKAIEANVRESGIVGLPPGLPSVDKSEAVRRWQIEKHEAAVTAATDRILTETATQTIASFKKRFGKET